MSGGWGSGGWGGMGWGGGGGSLAIVAANAISERQVQVELTTEPLHVSTIGLGDALNPLTWSVVNDATGEELVVIGARMIDTTLVELYTLVKFGASLIDHTVSSSTLLDSNGSPIVSPTSVDFLGCLKGVPSEIPDDQVDLANLQVSPDTLAGVLRIGSDGDYVHQSGEELLQKLIIRRLTTTPNEFFYLPTYGLGLRVKEPFYLTDMPKLQSAAQLQLSQEPEISEVRVQASISSNGILLLGVRARLRKTNQQVRTTIPIPTNLVEL